MLPKGFGKQLFPKFSCNWFFSPDFSVLFLFCSFTSLEVKLANRRRHPGIFFSQSPSKHWGTGGQLSDSLERSFIVPHQCRYPPRTSSQGHKQRNSIALDVETLSFMLSSCPAVLQTDACSERCLWMRGHPQSQCAISIHSTLWDWMARVRVIVVLLESKCAQFFQSVLNWSFFCGVFFFFPQSWSMIVGKKQWVLLRTYCSSTCLPPAQRLFCFFRLHSQASSASAAKLSQSQFYNDWQKGDSGRKAACFLLCQIHVDASVRSREGSEGALHQRGRRFGKAPSVSREREALGTEVKSRPHGALWNSFVSVLIGRSSRQRNRNWVFFFFFLRKMILSFPNQSGEWLVRGRTAQQLGGLAVSRRKSFCWGRSMCLRTCKLGRERTSFAEKMRFGGYVRYLWATEEQCPAEGASQRLFCQNCEKLENCL